jgi:hypothetical protein
MAYGDLSRHARSMANYTPPDVRTAGGSKVTRTGSSVSFTRPRVAGAIDTSSPYGFAQNMMAEMKKAQEEAKQANIQRYEDILQRRETGYGKLLAEQQQYTGQDIADAEKRNLDLRSSLRQQAISSGMGGVGSFRAAQERGAAGELQADINRIRDARLKERLGIMERVPESTHQFMERRTDAYPDLGGMYDMMSKYAQMSTQARRAPSPSRTTTTRTSVSGGYRPTSSAAPTTMGDVRPWTWRDTAALSQQAKARRRSRETSSAKKTSGGGYWDSITILGAEPDEEVKLPPRPQQGYLGQSGGVAGIEFPEGPSGPYTQRGAVGQTKGKSKRRSKKADTLMGLPPDQAEDLMRRYRESQRRMMNTPYYKNIELL